MSGGGFAAGRDVARRSRPAYRNSTARGIESFADDLTVQEGPVSSRVALSLRSAEGKPFFALISHISSPGGVDRRSLFFFPGKSSRVGPARGVTLELGVSPPG